MSYRPLMILGAVVLLVLAATTIGTQQFTWNPPWTARLGMGAAGVLLAFGAAWMVRATRNGSNGDTPGA